MRLRYGSVLHGPLPEPKAVDLNAITLTELRYVVAVADHGHFGRAADACHVSQPTLSTQIRKLEDQLGLAIFERGSRRVRLTAAGERIVDRARRVLDELRALGDAAKGHGDPLAGVFRLGVIPTLGPYLLPWLLRPLQQAYPRLELVLHESITSTLLDDLASHRLDAALMALPVASPGLESAALFDEPFTLLLPPEHGLAAKTKVRLGDLEGERILLLTEGHCLRDQALDFCGAARSAGDDAFRATSLETLRHMVGAGLGCTLMPALAVRADGAAKGRRSRGPAAVPFAAPAPYRRVGLVWRRSYPDAAAIAELVRFVREHLPQGVLAVRGS